MDGAGTNPVGGGRCAAEEAAEHERARTAHTAADGSPEEAARKAGSAAGRKTAAQDSGTEQTVLHGQAGAREAEAAHGRRESAGSPEAVRRTGEASA